MGKDYKELIFGMMRTGILGFGGGPSVIPLIRYEAVSRYQWLDDDEFGDTLAIANTLPGPIATKMAAYLGYQVKGWMGAFVSVMAHVLPTCLAMVFLVAFINRNGRILLPSGQDCIRVGDTVMIVTTHNGFDEIEDILR